MALTKLAEGRLQQFRPLRECIASGVPARSGAGVVLSAAIGPDGLAGIAAMSFPGLFDRGDALLVIGIDFAWRQRRFRLLLKLKAQTRKVSTPWEVEAV